MSAGTSGLCVVRVASASDAVAILPLIRDHAAYEQGSAISTAAALQNALSGCPRLLHGWIAEVDGEIVGYATATLDFSTWSGRQFLHLDCLFVRASHRGQRLGVQLLDAVCDYAAMIGINEIQWQTPAWNKDACRFYRREGATALPKMRFTKVVGAPKG